VAARHIPKERGREETPVGKTVNILLRKGREINLRKGRGIMVYHHITEERENRRCLAGATLAKAPPVRDAKMMGKNRSSGWKATVAGRAGAAIDTNAVTVGYITKEGV